MIRKGVTLVETIVVLMIGLLISIPIVMVPNHQDRNWECVKTEFQQTYLLMQQQANLGYFSEFDIFSRQQTIFIGEEEIALPADWQACNYTKIRWKKTYVTAGTIRFFNVKTKKYVSLIFQLGGGTYRFTT